MARYPYDICVIGAGSGGLSVAAGAAQMGANVLLIEKGKMGGDCLNTGCVPSKSLLAAAHAAQAIRTADQFGICTTPPEVDMHKVHAHIHGVIGAIEPHDSQERFEGLGCTVIRDAARFVDAHTVEAGGQHMSAKRFVIATGSSPAIPPIEGIEDVPYFTNESIFDNDQPLPHLLVIGGGPIGLEMAQAYARLGSHVTVLVRSKLLPKDDPELAAVVQQCLETEGITLHIGLDFHKVVRVGEGLTLTATKKETGENLTIEASHLLVAAGRTPNVNGLNLAAAGVDFSLQGIPVDHRLRSSQKHIFAIGDVVGPYQFTHMAGYHAGIVIRNILFRLPAKVNYAAVPWVTYTDPELAWVGLSEAKAKARGVWTQTLNKPMQENDRARAEGERAGMIKVVLGKKGLILGAGIVGRGAGELLAPWIFAIQKGWKIGAMTAPIIPYPTRSEIHKGVAGQYFTPTLYGEKTRRIVRWLLKLG
ncbi:dihydrolipoyl dehydrogenase family protein [Magnetococcus sp. PR-3]|uniref:dihydrolipoyl dehydrogenase family protein n=1 Tax=Magnetococcus sp. PR-3 TaxID=3120355 RepID=UPI002FCE446E